MVSCHTKGEKLYAYDFKMHIQRTTDPLQSDNCDISVKHRKTNMFGLSFEIECC